MNNLKLSDAMELGWKTLPKIQGVFQEWDSQDCVTGACAIGAACYAANPLAKVRDFEQARALFPELDEPVEVYQDRELIFEGTLEDFITDLNDGGNTSHLVPDTSQAGIVRYVRRLGF
jgi:hypothetical protein